MKRISDTDIPVMRSLLAEEGVHEQMLLRENVDLRLQTTMRVGGPARLFAEPENEDQAVALLRAAKSLGVPYIVIGNGSNIVVADSGAEALIIRLADRFSEITEVKRRDLPSEPSDKDGNPIPDEPERICYRVQAGALLSSVAVRAAKAGGAGMEFAGGIPGSIGGAVYMNAGAYGSEMSDILVFARSVDPDGTLRDYRVDEMELGYRSSRFSRKGGVLLSVYLLLGRDKPEAILARMSELNGKRASCQPLNMPSCGSAFKRPPGHYAGALIEQSGLKGFSIGGAQVSTKHAGFIVNTGNATAEDIRQLSAHIIGTVLEKTGVMLEPEICFIGFDKE
ncbi:MAG: UDP-N-acetylmuramate dehydrogenase [Clostridiaceae bacterium]|jgi:UDP-N-acetylmuramate dehydrogenase|nr:UDP-N-acetylmuramate dehydrogenase [Oscillospiraceae bacterium]NLO63437.1 UDP-N-acetylmuramate dehydrogenase [Clostridiaceae bacterium]